MEAVPVQVTRRTLHVFTPLLVALVLAGCSVWDSATSYFNTYYNAVQLFQGAEEEIWAQPDVRFSGRNPLALVSVPPAARTKLTSVIEKCSKLLQYHPGSNLVDDALVMIGKSFYYQGEYQRAERKFKELLDGYAKEGLGPEAKLWLSCAYVKMNAPADAARLAQELVAEGPDRSSDGIVSRAALVLARIETESKNLPRAKQLYEESAGWADNNDLRSSVWCNLAAVDSMEGDFAAAERAYRRAYAAADNFSAEYKTQLGIARMLSRQGRFEGAFDLLRVLRRNQNNRESFGEIDLEIARVYRNAGELESAVIQYKNVDTLYARTEWSVRAAYELGGLYEGSFRQLDSARAVYTRAKNILPATPINVELVRKADVFARYAAFRTDLSRYDSLRLAILSSPALRPAVADSAGRSGRTDSSAARGARDSLRVAPPLLSADSIDARRSSTMSELANLFYASMEMRDSALFWYGRVLAEYPRRPVAAGALYVLAQISSTDTLQGGARADSLYHELLSRFPESEFGREARRRLGLPGDQASRDSIESLYAEAEAMFLHRKELPAIDALHSLAARFPASAAAPRALYAIGWVYERHLSRPDSALAAYRRLVAAYPGSPFAATVRPLILEAEASKKGIPPGKDSAAVLNSGASVDSRVKPPIDDEVPLSRRARKAGEVPLKPAVPPGEKRPEPTKD